MKDPKVEQRLPSHVGYFPCPRKQTSSSWRSSFGYYWGVGSPLRESIKLNYMCTFRKDLPAQIRAQRLVGLAQLNEAQLAITRYIIGVCVFSSRVDRLLALRRELPPRPWRGSRDHPHKHPTHQGIIEIPWCQAKSVCSKSRSPNFSGWLDREPGAAATTSSVPERCFGSPEL